MEEGVRKLCELLWSSWRPDLVLGPIHPLFSPPMLQDLIPELYMVSFSILGNFRKLVEGLRDFLTREEDGEDRSRLPAPSRATCSAAPVVS